ncbi:MAG TPA: hypothetical protein VD973_17955 [Symbiobacteriaceae bacterium]|nr:hypothetical protein [Symbiobacteriaceae bacterium]
MAYLLLLACAVTLLIYTYRRAPERWPSHLVSMMAMSASLGLIDLIICELLQLYTFHPGLAPDLVRDNLLGAVLADYLFLSITFGCLMVLFPRHRTLAGAGLILLIAGVEIVFRRYGLFVYHFWSIWATIVLFALRFALAVWWLDLLERVGYSPVFRLLFSAVSSAFFWWFYIALTSGLPMLWGMRLHLLGSPAADRVLSIYLLHGLTYGSFSMLFLYRRWGDQAWHWWGFGAGWAAYLYILRALGIYRHLAGWSPLYDAAALTALLWVCTLLDHWMDRNFHSSRPRARD